MSEREQSLAHSRLLEVVSYDPETGIFTWRKPTSVRVKVGDVCGQVDRHGHRLINVDGWRYMAHRIAWFYVHGSWPAQEIDHINLSRDDNRIANLREANRAENNRNVGLKRHNKLGVKGVHRHSQAKHKFVAAITVDGRSRYLGMFDTAEEAHACYERASEQYHGTYGRLR